MKCKRLLCALLVCLMAMSVLPLAAFAQGPIDVDASCSLTIDYHYEDLPIPGATFQIYYFAAVDAATNFTLTEQFRKYPVRLDDNSAESWTQLALTMKGYVQVDNVAPDYTRQTDETGRITLTGLKTGLYLVVGAKRTVGEYTYTAAPFIAAVPARNNENNTWDYDVTVVPKLSRDKNPSDEPTDKVISRKVLKVWEDNGYTKKRPKEIIVQLLKDGKVYETVTLNEANNWRYFWDNLPACDENGAKIEWTVVEKDISGYTVKIEQDGITFVITNTYKNPPATTKPPILPQTGVMWWPVPILACAGILFLVLGIVRRRSSEE